MVKLRHLLLLSLTHTLSMGASINHMFFNVFELYFWLMDYGTEWLMMYCNIKYSCFEESVPDLYSVRDRFLFWPYWKCRFNSVYSNSVRDPNRAQPYLWVRHTSKGMGLYSKAWITLYSKVQKQNLKDKRLHSNAIKKTVALIKRVRLARLSNSKHASLI